LHDRVGPLLTAAGLRLQLLRMDQPKSAEAVGEVLEQLDEVMDQVREVSQSLASSPAYRIGLRGALEKLIRECWATFQGTVQMKFTATIKLQPELGALFYDAIASALAEATARPGSNKVTLSVTGSGRQLTARIQDNGQDIRKAVFGISRVLAEQAGFVFSKSTGKGTIVLIRYGLSRPSRG
jgi:signal transduction histidine kinase